MSISSSTSTLLVCSVLVVAPIALVHAQAPKATLHDPVVSTAPVPPTVYVSVFDAYRAAPRERLWPWTQLFAPDGTLVERATRDAGAIEVTVRKPGGEHETHGAGRTVSVAPTPSATQAMDPRAGHEQRGSAPAAVALLEAPPPPGTDLIGIVQTIDRASSSIELKHGPIAKLGMGAMTMWFPVKEAALLGRLAVGERFAFTVEMTDRGVVISDVQKVPEK